MPAVDVENFASLGTVASLVAPRSFNTLLASLPHADYERIAPHLKRAPMRLQQIFYRQDQPIEHVLFPGGGACSLIKVTEDGEAAEVGTIGSEGAVGTNVFFGQRESPCEVRVQVSSPFADLMSTDIFLHEMERRGALFSLMIRYNQALMSQIMQTTLCNGLHSAEERCCRWILMTHDSARRNEFAVTHQLIAARLGVRRPTVTIIVAKLQKEAVIQYRRGAMTIIDRKRLELASCKCYDSVKSSFNRLLPEINAGSWR